MRAPELSDPETESRTGAAGREELMGGGSTALLQDERSWSSLPSKVKILDTRTVHLQ